MIVFCPRRGRESNVAAETHLTGGGRILCVPEAGADHGVLHAITPEFLLPTSFEVDDGEAGLVQGLCQGNIFLPTWSISMKLIYSSLSSLLTQTLYNAHNRPKCLTRIKSKAVNCTLV